MNDSPILVLTAPGDQSIPFLAELRQMATIVVGDSARDFASRGDAEIILNWSSSLELLRDVFLMSKPRALDPFPVRRLGTDDLP